MTNRKKVSSILAALAVIVALVICYRLWVSLETSRSDVADNKTPLAEVHATDADAIRRGEYVMRLSDCAACHESNFAGGYKIDTPFGVLKTSNITPDRNTGIGNMTEQAFYNAVRQGKGQHGFLYPAMPYTAYSRLSDQDMHDLWQYLSTVTPVSQKIDENGEMKFPFNIRLAMAGWDMLFFDNKGFVADTTKDSQWNRGKYLVDGAAHCSVCHSPRNILGGEIHSQYLQGGSLGAWYAPDITPNPVTGIGRMSQQDIISYLKTGSDGTAVAAGPMAEAVEHSMQYFTDSDLHAVADYLQSLPPSPGKAPASKSLSPQQNQQAALTYEVDCSACHGTRGEGISGMVPAFAGNQGMLNNPTNMITAILNGARAPHTQQRQTAAGMPAFAWKMDDQQIAGLLNYLRNSWGNKAAEVKASDVEKLRKSTGASSKLTAPPAKAAAN
ncbi:alcohol dehydrogenase [Tatumella morbirosei]|uniref:Alcohol dehydrogenase n=1 Tax=Tatumella morbirosei TaxID=642227 RepID=A0A095V6G3_9GAMM|nr:c-type cytochrome [Tatumella morbirosei]KGD70405.1 alcohol dehydrogenase [Tatumella morbirosei]